MEVLQFTPAEAERYLSEGTPAAAELIIRETLSRNPRDPAAWLVLSRVSAALGDGTGAERFARVAKDLSDTAAPARGGGDRFLLIKAWGYGFCSDLDHVLGGLLLCEISGRTPVTHWGGNSLFSADPGKDAFREYFEPLSPFSIDDLVGKGHDFWPPKWRESNLRAERFQKQWGEHSRVSSLEMVHRPERVVVSDYHSGIAVLQPWIPAGHPMHGRPVDDVYRYLFSKYIKPAPDIKALVDEFAAAYFTNRPIIAVHIRGGDKYQEDPQLQQKIAVYPQAIEHLSQGNLSAKIFLLTDATQIVEDYKKRYGPRLIVADCLRTSTQKGLHYMGYPDRRRLGVEVLRDMYLAARCDKFIGIGSSNVSCMISYVKAWPPGSVVMLGPMMTGKTEPYLYMNYEQLKRYFASDRVENWKRTQA